MKRTLLTLLTMVIVITARPACADDQPAVAGPTPAKTSPAPRNALSLQLIALFSSGVTAQYERFVSPRHRLSLATSLGARSSGGPTFDVLEGSSGFEGRYWFVGKAPFSSFEGPAMVGPFLGLRADFGITRVADDDRVLGTTLRTGQSIALGARVSVGGRVELTPSFGTGIRTDIDPRGRRAAWTHWELVRFGMTAGIMF